MRFLAIILSLVSCIDLILHMMIELYVFHHSATLPGQWRIIQKSQKSIFEWSEVPKMRFLAIILSLVCWIDLILHMMIELYSFHHLATLPGHEGSFQRFLFVLADLLPLWHSNVIHTAKPIIPSNHYAIQFVFS